MNHRRSLPHNDDAEWRRRSAGVDATTGASLTTNNEPIDADQPAHTSTERHRHRAPTLPSEPLTPTKQPAFGHRPDRKTVHIKRVGAHSPAADWTANGVAADPEPRDIHGRRPVRALVVGLLLASAILVGAGVAALAMGATPPGATPTPAMTPGAPAGGAPAVSTPATSSLSASLPSLPADSAPQQESSVPDPSSSVPGPFVTPNQGAVDPPATVSTLAPDDPGFGWPSSAFGVVP